MEYRRYALGSFGEIKWIRCIECSNPDAPFYVWEGRERTANLALPIGAVMEHELKFHPALPQRR